MIRLVFSTGGVAACRALRHISILEAPLFKLCGLQLMSLQRNNTCILSTYFYDCDDYSISSSYGLSKEEAESYVLCDTIGSTGNHQWRPEGFRVVGDNEKPLLLQALWKPREGLARRFEIQRRSWVEERTSKDKDTITAGTVSLSENHIPHSNSTRRGLEANLKENIEIKYCQC